MPKAIAIYIDPQGDEWFHAYGPKTKLRDKATRFVSAEVAIKAARATLFGNPDAFWNSERTHADNTRATHRGWSYRIEEVADSDKKREGYSVARYKPESPVRHYLVIGGGFTTEEGRAALWDTRPKAMEIANGINKPEGWQVCVQAY